MDVQYKAPQHGKTQDRPTTERKTLTHSRSSSTPAALTTHQDPLDSDSEATHQDRKPPTTTDRSANAHGGGNKNITIFHIFYGAPSQQDRLQRKRNKNDNRPIYQAGAPATSTTSYQRGP
jgi:hypothetical protein